MDIQDIEIFARVAVVQNLSAVGSELGLTPGTISKRLQALEDQLSVRLFERTTRSIRITAEGARFLKHVETILDELDRAKASVADTVGQPKGRLRILVSDAIARSFVMPAVLTFMAQYRDIELQVDLSDQLVNLQEAGYDVAIHSGTLNDSPLIAKRLAHDRYILVAAPSYVAAKGAPEGIEDLTQHDCLAFGDTWTWTLTCSGGKGVSVRIEPRLRSNHADVLRLAALDGRGIARVSELNVRRDLNEGRLVHVLQDFECARDAGVWALYPSTKHVLPRLRVFLDFLGDWFRVADYMLKPPLNPPPSLIRQ
jgi:DNA-binding transcriptional LysR family regulator